MSNSVQARLGLSGNDATARELAEAIKAELSLSETPPQVVDHATGAVTVPLGALMSAAQREKITTILNNNGGVAGGAVMPPMNPVSEDFNGYTPSDPITQLLGSDVDSRLTFSSEGCTIEASPSAEAKGATGSALKMIDSSNAGQAAPGAYSYTQGMALEFVDPALTSINHFDMGMCVKILADQTPGDQFADVVFDLTANAPSGFVQLKASTQSLGGGVFGNWRVTSSFFSSLFPTSPNVWVNLDTGVVGSDFLDLRLTMDSSGLITYKYNSTTATQSKSGFTVSDTRHSINVVDWDAAATKDQHSTIMDNLDLSIAGATI